jgi:deoxyribodipyrimidine photo-lyase
MVQALFKSTHGKEITAMKAGKAENTDSAEKSLDTGVKDIAPGSYVLYWMQAAQRAVCNPALEHAIRLANSSGTPLVVLFCLDPEVPDANIRHFRFLLQGLWETASQIEARGAGFHLAVGNLAEVVSYYGRKALAVVTETAVLRWQRETRLAVKKAVTEGDTVYTEVSTESIVPVTVASGHEEYSAATLRSKLVKLLPDHLLAPAEKAEVMNQIYPALPELPVTLGTTLDIGKYPDVESFQTAAQKELLLDPGLSASTVFRGGYSQANERLRHFIAAVLPNYAQRSNDPAADLVSGLSPYLHFGHISPLEVALEVMEACGVSRYELPGMIRSKSGLAGLKANCAAFLEQLIVRRELSMNFCYYNPRYDEYLALPVWARESLERHLGDKRPVAYAPGILEAAETADPYWNAAQKEMLISGKMHNYMRMYWGKKVIEWCADPQQAFYLLQYLNDRYELDGRDPNGFTGIAWCFGKHDRPWQSRPIFGNVRYMNAKGLERKFDIAAYVERIERLKD